MDRHAGVEKYQNILNCTRRCHVISMYLGNSVCKKGKENSKPRPILPKAPSLDGLRPRNGDARGCRKISKCFELHPEMPRHLHVCLLECVQKRTRKFQA